MGTFDRAAAKREWDARTLERQADSARERARQIRCGQEGRLMPNEPDYLDAKAQRLEREAAEKRGRS